MNENEKKNTMTSEEQEATFKNALFDAIKSTERGSDAYIDPVDGCIVLPKAIRIRKRPSDQNNS